MNVEQLDLSHNLVKALEGMVQLRPDQSLDFRCSQLEVLASEALDQLCWLSSLTLASSLLDHNCLANDRALQFLCHPQVLDLSANCLISDMTAYQVTKLSSLESLNLSDNHMTHLAWGAFLDPLFCWAST